MVNLMTLMEIIMITGDSDKHIWWLWVMMTLINILVTQITFKVTLITLIVALMTLIPLIWNDRIHVMINGDLASASNMTLINLIKIIATTNDSDNIPGNSNEYWGLLYLYWYLQWLLFWLQWLKVTLMTLMVTLMTNEFITKCHN